MLNGAKIKYDGFLALEVLRLVPEKFQVAYVDHLIILGNRTISDFSELFSTSEKEARDYLFKINRYKSGAEIKTPRGQQQRDFSAYLRWENSILGEDSYEICVSFVAALNIYLGKDYVPESEQPIRLMRNLIRLLVENAKTEAEKSKREAEAQTLEVPEETPEAAELFTLRPISSIEFMAMDELERADYVLKIANEFGVSLGGVLRTLFGTHGRAFETSVYRTLKQTGRYAKYEECTRGKYRRANEVELAKFSAWAQDSKASEATEETAGEPNKKSRMLVISWSGDSLTEFYSLAAEVAKLVQASPGASMEE